MKSIFTAVLLCIACIAFAGCAEYENDMLELETEREWKIRTRYAHKDYLEIVDEFNHRIHTNECSRWNWEWARLPYKDANYWQGRHGDEAAKPAHKRDYAKAMTDPDTGIRFHIGGWHYGRWCCGT